MPSSPISPCPSCPPHAAGGHGCAVYSSSVTDAEWAILEPLLPAPGSTAGRGGRPEKHCRRVIVDAILYIVRGGIAWRQLPVGPTQPSSRRLGTRKLTCSLLVKSPTDTFRRIRPERSRPKRTHQAGGLLRAVERRAPTQILKVMS